MTGRFEKSISADYFDAMYATNPDPWHFAASEYERAKYAATLAALPKAQYHAALEVGCSIGVLTRQLAQRCDRLLALDVAKAALEQAAARNADLLQSEFVLMKVPEEWPDGRFDLIVLSEVVYYLDQQDVDRLASRVKGAVAPAADIILVHWLGDTHYPLTGDEAADRFIRAVQGTAEVTHQSRTDAYRLDVLRVG